MSKPSSPCAPPEVHTSRGTIPAFSHSAWNGATFLLQPAADHVAELGVLGLVQRGTHGGECAAPPTLLERGTACPAPAREEVCAAGEEGALLCGNCRLPGGGPGGRPSALAGRRRPRLRRRPARGGVPRVRGLPRPRGHHRGSLAWGTAARPCPMRPDAVTSVRCTGSPSGK